MNKLPLICAWMLIPALCVLALTPENTMCELLAKPGLVPVTDATPEFSWSFNSKAKGELQTAYQIQVVSDTKFFKVGPADLWDSGQVNSADSLFVPYQGAALPAGRSCFWRVKVWDAKGKPGDWSQVLAFKMSDTPGADTAIGYELKQSHVKPVSITTNDSGHVMVDFGRAAFGWVELISGENFEQGPFTLHLGERARDGHVYRTPGGSIRYAVTKGALTRPGVYRVPLTADKRNTTGAAVLLPAAMGVVMPFRYVEIEQAPFPITVDNLRQIAVYYPFDDDNSSFSSSDPVLDQVYDLCKYSIKATSFAGLYVDGDRERIPYEADAYINQLCHYAVDREYTMARLTHEYLMDHPTWPTEWKQHSIMIAWEDWVNTGNIESLERCYDALKNNKLLQFVARKGDGLLLTGTPEAQKITASRDIVDWPAGERDGFDFKPVNTVINAFYYYNLLQMADIAHALGKLGDAEAFVKQAQQIKIEFNRLFYNTATGRYVDGEGSTHSSLHANMLPLAFDLVPEGERERVTQFVKSRRMSCSVYAAQYLLEALFKAGQEDYALWLMARDDLRSWVNMIQAGSTVTLEAWDIMLKPNLDWNHAWGAVPANILPRYVLGVKPRVAGFKEIWIRPQVGSLTHAKGRVPTIRGFVDVEINQIPGARYALQFSIPANTTASVVIPWQEGAELRIDGKKSRAVVENNALVIENMSSGPHEIIWATELAQCESNEKKPLIKRCVSGLLSRLPFL
ncbi:MAG: alpha-L-rhamnosidase C-terminal domain-containing protein [Kiritimatiellae bacterium]|nr:alpha-L-rhamnosidase C-terminal domain-containing protein [Kiritimatiellia bacterium]